jgi:homoserine dehydrogenase
MKAIKTVLIGLGTVNIGLLKILQEKEADMANYGLSLNIVGVADSSGIAINKNGFDHALLMALKANGGHAKDLDGYLPGIPTEDLPDMIEADLLVEGSPVDLDTGNPGLQVIRKALSKGWHVVSANKAPLVLAFDALLALAAEKKCKLLYSATVCGGLPVINVLQRDLKASRLIRLQGIFNATTNFILQALEAGGDFDAAVKRAQEVGAAEADPSLDVDGYDAANKLYIIMKSFTDYSGSIADIKTLGIRNIDADAIARASSGNKRIKLIAKAERIDGKWSLTVEPTEVDIYSFLGNCDGWEMGIQIETDYYEKLSLKLREEEPMSTCAAVLRDIINIYS